MERSIVGFHRDDAGDWVADLECGHTQHVRHRPPWQNRPWVTNPEGRREKLGARLDCHHCDMPNLPPDAVPYKRTDTFTQDTTPAKLLDHHRTKAGVWAKIIVEEGELSYVIADRPGEGFILKPGYVGVAEPEALHSVKPRGKTRFYVEFWREPAR